MLNSLRRLVSRPSLQVATITVLTGCSQVDAPVNCDGSATAVCNEQGSDLRIAVVGDDIDGVCANGISSLVVHAWTKSGSGDVEYELHTSGATLVDGEEAKINGREAEWQILAGRQAGDIVVEVTARRGGDEQTDTLLIPARAARPSALAVESDAPILVAGDSASISISAPGASSTYRVCFGVPAGLHVSGATCTANECHLSVGGAGIRDLMVAADCSAVGKTLTLSLAPCADQAETVDPEGRCQPDEPPQPAVISWWVERSERCE
jgi:hypothetical protein